MYDQLVTDAINYTTQLARHGHQCPQQDSNPQSQQ
jgi:hypothetical protein